MRDDLVWLAAKRNRGWPQPEESFGLTPIFGHNGWCLRCGIPRRPQCGSLILRQRGQLRGAWRPNWLFDVLCLERSLADVVAARFGVELREVVVRGTTGSAAQLVVPVGGPWYAPEDLERATVARHGSAGATCPECGVWRWLPLLIEDRPPLRTPPPASTVVADSGEWFGAGRNGFRHQLFCRELAELIVAASPRDFMIEMAI